jgi:divalent metal cation (Fe/Co/Zn/Cd) transporter
VLSAREGYHKLQHPESISHIGLTYLAIALGIIFETIAFRIALRSVKREMQREKHSSFFEAVRHSKDPTTITVLVEDALALAGLVIAAMGITLVHLTGILVFDAIASILIGVLLMVFALFLASETRKLLLGEAVTLRRRKEILGCIESFDEVKQVLSLKTMHLSTEDVIVAVEINYRDDLTVDSLEELNDKIEWKIKDFIPNAKVYLEAENKGD